MGRFSIKYQLLILGSVFVLQTVAVAVFSGWMQKRLTVNTHFGHDIAFQNEVLVEMSSAINRIGSGLLEFEHSLSGKIDPVFEELALLPDIVARSEVAFVETETAAARRPDVPETLKGVLTYSTALGPQLEFLVAPGVTIFETDAVLSDQVLPALSEMRNIVQTVRRENSSIFAAAEAEADRIMEQSFTWLLMVNAAAVSLGLICVLIFGRVLSKPFQGAAAAVRGIAGGDYETAISGTDRGDEAGQIARNLEELRDKLLQADGAAKLERQSHAKRLEMFDVLGNAMSGLAQGEVNERLDADKWSDLGANYVALCTNFNDLSAKIGDMIGSLRDSADMVQRNSRELSSMSTEMSRRSEVQAATLEESAAALEELSSSVKAAAARAEEADQRVGEGRIRAEEGGAVMERALAAMSSIAASSDQITQIIGVIDDIAFQTNLLALNAGVEAARAGESGKGFSVVASEVRSLAQRASESAREIKALVSNSSQQVKDGGQLVEQTGVALSDIVRNVTEVSGLVAEIASAAREQSAGLQEINVGVAELDKVTQQNAAMVGETSSASQQLNSEAQRLTAQLERFLGDAVEEGEDEVTPVSIPIEDFDPPAPSAPPESVQPAPARAVANSDVAWEDF
ncbi:methyl-accepting chemotaxis protein [Salipiger sp.]|uniref:methyl-accepting chemotaxis protein n=1 Tax=Salipiger sp. TaxID=2078585 RepID=UPI003A984259